MLRLSPRAYYTPSVQVASHPATAPAVIIVAADQIARPHLERLADACDHRGVPVTLLFRIVPAPA
jgi:hypothetical protein